MSQTKKLSVSYQNLLKSVKAALAGGFLAAQKVLEYERLKTYWQIGKEIIASVAASKGELHPGEALYGKISHDIRRDMGLDLSADYVGRMVQFYRNYPRFPKGTTLTFTHYLALQRIKNPVLRLRLEKNAIKKKLSALEVKEEVARMNLKSRTLSSKSRQSKRLKCERGEPYVYYVRPQITLSGRESFCIDCGFKINTSLPKNQPFAPDQRRIIRSVKEDGGYTIHYYRQGQDKLYTYAATVNRVLDGDTLDVAIDVGFGIGLSDRLRLAGINAPEIRTPAGRLALKFLKDYLKKCPIIIIRTSKSGKYGRWLGDIFAKPGSKEPHRIAAEGEYLNQIMLDKGLAELYQS